MSTLRIAHRPALLGLALGALLLFARPVQADTVDVSIDDFFFAPDSTAVKVGTTVRWTNNGASTHTTTSDDAVWDSGNLNTNDQFSFTFDSAATYPYSCTIHPSMKGKVVVTGRVPSLTPYGLMVLLVLLAGSALWILRQKRTATLKRQ